MTTYGLTADGFVIKTFEIIRAEIEEELRGTFGASLPLGDGTDLGKAVAIFAEREASVWELMEAVHNSQSPGAATGSRLEDLSALTGTLREKASSSLVTLALTGTAATVVPADSQASVTGSDERFSTDEDATLIAATSWVALTAYALGDRVTNASRVYQCTVAGTSAGSGGPTTTDDAIVDNTVTWRYLGEGTAIVDVGATAANTGPIVGASGTIENIVTPVSGWESVINVLDADLGSDIETDESLRLRREDEIADAGNTTINAARACVLDVDNVTSARGFWNNTDTTDADGVPPHAVEFMVQGGEDQDIWDALLQTCIAGGIQTHGDEIGTSTDSEGTVHTVAFSRPEEIEIYHELVIEYDASLYPSDGDDQVKAAIVLYGDAQSTGRDATPRAATAAAMGVTGVTDVTTSEVGLSPGGVADTPVVITSRQLAVYDTSRIALTSSGATP